MSLKWLPATCLELFSLVTVCLVRWGLRFEFEGSFTAHMLLFTCLRVPLNCVVLCWIKFYFMTLVQSANCLWGVRNEGRVSAWLWICLQVSSCWKVLGLMNADRGHQEPRNTGGHELVIPQIYRRPNVTPKLLLLKWNIRDERQNTVEQTIIKDMLKWVKRKS